MGRWDACSDYKRQTMLTGNATVSLFSLSVEKRKSEKKSLSVTAYVIYFIRWWNLLKRRAEVHYQCLSLMLLECFDFRQSVSDTPVSLK